MNHANPTIQLPQKDNAEVAIFTFSFLLCVDDVMIGRKKSALSVDRALNVFTSSFKKEQKMGEALLCGKRYQRPRPRSADQTLGHYYPRRYRLEPPTPAMRVQKIWPGSR
ncbi:MAG: hypothetical protein HYT37_02010 [Candidatus Sungbacteria bacterium]|nr:hypothetical protein [Candidatus Sungbacteria bacterium]